MNWSDVIASSPSPFQAMTRHRAGLLRPGMYTQDDVQEPKMEEKMMPDDGGVGGGMMPSALRFPDTHLGRMESVFSDRMPCTGMYNLPSLASDGSFSMQDLESSGGGISMVSLNQSSLPSLDASTSESCGYALPATLDLRQFEESNEVDLQQLFPSSHSVPSLHPPINSLGHGSGSGSGGGGGANDGDGGEGNSFLSHHVQQSVLRTDHGGLSCGGAVDQFTEPYSSLHASDHAVNSHMMMPFPFAAAQEVFDDADELAVPSGSMEMQEVTHLFRNNVLMTPPTAITMPRTSIVSPMNSMGLPRSLLPTSMRATNEYSAECGMDVSMENPPPRFSLDRRKLCCVEGCKSQARAFNRCKRHGGSKRCSHAGCTKSVQSRGLCIRHGGGSRCQENGCTRAAQSHGKCKMHGGGRPCVVPGCEKKAHLKRLCRKHGGGAKCSLPECEKWAQRQGMCMTHSKHQSSLLASPPPSQPPPISSSSFVSTTASKRPARSFLVGSRTSI